MRNGFFFFALLCAPAVLALSGCGGRSDEVVPAPVASEESDVPEGMTDAEYAKAMQESMNQ